MSRARRRELRSMCAVTACSVSAARVARAAIRARVPWAPRARNWRASPSAFPERPEVAAARVEAEARQEEALLQAAAVERLSCATRRTAPAAVSTISACSRARRPAARSARSASRATTSRCAISACARRLRRRAAAAAASKGQWCCCWHWRNCSVGAGQSFLSFQEAAENGRYKKATESPKRSDRLHWAPRFSPARTSKAERQRAP